MGSKFKTHILRLAFVCVEGIFLLLPRLLIQWQGLFQCAMWTEAGVCVILAYILSAGNSFLNFVT